MIRLEVQYFNINRILLLAIGLWPYQQSIFTRFQFIFLSSILTTCIIFQVRDSIIALYFQLMFSILYNVILILRILRYYNIKYILIKYSIIEYVIII